MHRLQCANTNSAKIDAELRQSQKNTVRRNHIYASQYFSSLPRFAFNFDTVIEASVFLVSSFHVHFKSLTKY